MNKDYFLEMLESAQEDEYGRLYVLGEQHNKIYFGTITTICEDIFELKHGKLYQNTSELYDRHFWNDDTFEAHVVSNRNVETIKYKQPKRIKKIDNNDYDNYDGNISEEAKARNDIIVDKINEIIDILNKYECLNEKMEDNYD